MSDCRQRNVSRTSTSDLPTARPLPAELFLLCARMGAEVKRVLKLMEKNADRKLMYLGDFSSRILAVEGGSVNTRGRTPHNEIYGGTRDSPPLPRAVPVCLHVVERT